MRSYGPGMIPDTQLRDPTAVLARLLDDELAFSPSFQGRYSNHGAMALIALHQMGASPERLGAELQRHGREESEPREDTELLAERIDEVARDGIEATVRVRAPALVTGPGSQLFHPLIRLAYALGVGHGGQVAAALLDWEHRFQPGPGDSSEASAALPDDLADVDPVDALSRFALAAHATAEEFVTLHLVTGARALRMVSRWVDEATAQQLAIHAARSMDAAYASVGAPPLLAADKLDSLRRGALPNRDQIAERAIASTDPHVIKLADVALSEEERTGDMLYRHLAARWLAVA